MLSLSNKLDDIMSKLQGVRENMENTSNDSQKEKIIEIYRNTFRYEYKNIRIRGIIAKGRDNMRFIRYNELFPKLYLDFYGLNPNLEDYRVMEVIIEENGNKKRYTIEKSTRRSDPHLGEVSERSKLPEAAFLKYDNKISRKLTEARPYLTRNTLYKYISKERDTYIAVPTALLINIIPVFEEFSHVLYASKPYTQNNPYTAIPYYGSNNIIKKPIKIDLEHLTTLILSKIVNQTAISFIFKGEVENINYSDLDRDEFEKEKIITKKSELEERLEYVTEKILEFLAMYGFIPTDIGFEQLGISNDKIKFIDIGSGFDVINKRSIMNFYRNILYLDIRDSFEESPYLNICKVDNLSQEIICRNGIISNKESRDTLIDILNKILNERDVKVIIRENLNENNIEKIRNITKEVLKIYKIVDKATRIG